MAAECTKSRVWSIVIMIIARPRSMSMDARRRDPTSLWRTTPEPVWNSAGLAIDAVGLIQREGT